MYPHDKINLTPMISRGSAAVTIRYRGSHAQHEGGVVALRDQRHILRLSTPNSRFPWLREVTRDRGKSTSSARFSGDFTAATPGKRGFDT